MSGLNGGADLAPKKCIDIVLATFSVHTTNVQEYFRPVVDVGD